MPRGVWSEKARRLLEIRKANPQAWRWRIREALKSADGYIRDRGRKPGAATLLGVGRSTFQRWLAEDAELRAWLSPLLREVGAPGKAASKRVVRNNRTGGRR